MSEPGYQPGDEERGQAESWTPQGVTDKLQQAKETAWSADQEAAFMDYHHEARRDFLQGEISMSEHDQTLFEESASTAFFDAPEEFAEALAQLGLEEEERAKVVAHEKAHWDVLKKYDIPARFMIVMMDNDTARPAILDAMPPDMDPALRRKIIEEVTAAPAEDLSDGDKRALGL